MSIEGLNWARKIYVGDAMGKSLLRAIGDYADEHGHCWPSLARLADDCDMSVDTVRRRIKGLEDIGVIVTFRAWIDEHGKRNGEGRGRETSRDIRCLLDVVRTRAMVEQDDDGGAESDLSAAGGKVGVAAGEGSQQQGVGSQSARGGVALVPPLEPPLNTHLTETPPNPPPGGLEASQDDAGMLSLFEDFRRDYPRASVWDWSKALPLFRALTEAEREHARRAAPLYGKETAQGRPSPVRPERFLRARMFENFRVDGCADRQETTFVRVDPVSPEGRAVLTLCTLARASRPFASGDGKINYRGTITPQLLALADAPPRDDWLKVSDRQQLGAWSGFIGRYVTTARAPMESDDDGPYLRVPWPWPPRVDGTLSDDQANGAEA